MISVVAVVSFLALAPGGLRAQSLQGSSASMDIQVRIARQHDFTFIDTPARVTYFAEQGWLVRVRSASDFRLDNEVSYPYARPEVELFVRRLGGQYRSACGEQLVVTSLTRPTTRQPRNASARTVHPTGMAIDLRYSNNRTCRAWLERVLSDLERQGVLEATRERMPPHYHIAVFPRQYAAYVDVLQARRAETAGERLAYTVQSGDSLWKIARSHGTSVDDLKAVNGINGSRIFTGQVIDVPLDR
jgi:nucleoid-associated protein YgaU